MQEEHTPRFTVGDQVRVVSGDYAGETGRVYHVDPSGGVSIRKADGSGRFLAPHDLVHAGDHAPQPTDTSDPVGWDAAYWDRQLEGLAA